MKKTLFIIFLVILSSFAVALKQDDDKDGIPNTEDQCPAGSMIPVDSFGCDCQQKTAQTCPSGAPYCCKKCIQYESSARCVTDTDSDGIYDLFDKCPSTSAGPVDKSGCACAQKQCDDNNPCTDNFCNSTTIQCYFINDDSNSCGRENSCSDGTCISKNFNEAYYYIYDADKGTLRIFYTHSKHTIDVVFDQPLKDDIIIIDSTSNVLDYQVSKDRKSISVVVEGKDGEEGETSIKSNQEPKEVLIDEKGIPQVSEQPSPRNHTWIYLAIVIALLAALLVVVLSLRRHEDAMMGSIKKEEDKIEKEVDLEAELQLKMYISTNLRRGYSAMQIRNELVRDGWKPHIVDRALSSMHGRFYK